MLLYIFDSMTIIIIIDIIIGIIEINIYKIYYILIGKWYWIIDNKLDFLIGFIQIGIGRIEKASSSQETRTRHSAEGSVE